MIFHFSNIVVHSKKNKKDKEGDFSFEQLNTLSTDNDGNKVVVVGETLDLPLTPNSEKQDVETKEEENLILKETDPKDKENKIDKLNKKLDKRNKKRHNKKKHEGKKNKKNKKNKKTKNEILVENSTVVVIDQLANLTEKSTLQFQVSIFNLK